MGVARRLVGHPRSGGLRFRLTGPVLFLYLALFPLIGAAAEGGGGAPGPIMLFGTVEFRGALKNMPKWERVVRAEERSPTFSKNPASLMNANLARQWQELVARVEGAPTMDKVKAVNTFFNRWPYRLDSDVYKIEDYWATPAEFLKNSGDCEDYAITKFYALIKLGVGPDSMRIVALMDKIRNLGHAVLVVYTDNDAFILDNLTDMVMSHTRFRQYAPQYSVNGTYRWAHVMPKKKTP